PGKSLVAYKGELDDATKTFRCGSRSPSPSARARHHDRLEASRGDGRRENRQGAFDRTISGADMFGLPLSSGVAGIMAANGGGLQTATLRHLLMAWVLALPMAGLVFGRPFLVLWPHLTNVGRKTEKPPPRAPRRRCLRP